MLHPTHKIPGGLRYLRVFHVGVCACVLTHFRRRMCRQRLCACVLTHFRRRMCRQRLRNVFAPVCVDSVCACMSPCKHSLGIFTADFEFPVHATAMNCGVHVLLRHTFLVQQLPCTVLPPSFGVLRTFLLMLLILSSVLMA